MNQKLVAENRKARHEYELYDRFEAGLCLKAVSYTHLDVYKRQGYCR